MVIFIVGFLISFTGSLFIKRTRLFVGGGIGCVRIPLFVLTGGADPARIDEEFRKAWLPYFCRSGQREASREEFALEVDGWPPLLPVVSLPELTGEMLEEVVRRKSAIAGSLDGWVEGVEGSASALV